MSAVTAVGFLLCLLNLGQLDTKVNTQRKLQTYQAISDTNQSQAKITERDQKNWDKPGETVPTKCPTIDCSSLVPVCPQTDCTCTPDSTATEFKVPNIVHYAWYASSNTPMTFQHYIAILSAHKVLKPDKIYIHMNVSRPPGRYWDKITKLESVEALNEGLPRELLDVKLIPDNQIFLTDSHDIGRIKYLLQYGGIFLSYETILIQPFDDLRKSHEFVLIQDQGMQVSYGLLSNSIVMSARSSAFLYLWANSYVDSFQPRQWGYNLMQKPAAILKRFPQVLHLTSHKFRLLKSDPNEFAEIWGNKTFEWKDYYAVCIPYNFLRNLKHYRRMYGAVDPDENNIMFMDNSYGEIARHVLSLKQLIRIRD